MGGLGNSWGPGPGLGSETIGLRNAQLTMFKSMMEPLCQTALPGGILALAPFPESGRQEFAIDAQTK